MVFRNLPEVRSAHEILGVPTVSARFGTSPFFWNWGMEAMTKLLPSVCLSHLDIGLNINEQNLNGMDMYKVNQTTIFCVLPKASLTISPPSSLLSCPFILFLLLVFLQCTLIMCWWHLPCTLFTTTSKINRCYSPLLLYILVHNLQECNRKIIRPNFISPEINESEQLISQFLVNRALLFF